MSLGPDAGRREELLRVHDLSPAQADLVVQLDEGSCPRSHDRLVGRTAAPVPRLLLLVGVRGPVLLDLVREVDWDLGRESFCRVVHLRHRFLSFES